MFCVWVCMTRVNEKLSAYVTSYIAFIIIWVVQEKQKSQVPENVSHRSVINNSQDINCNNTVLCSSI